MHLTAPILRQLEARYGRPELATAATVFTPREYALVARCHRKARTHDVTLMIRDARHGFAVIRKPSYPSEVFRPPSGGVEPGETLEEGAVREAREETGLEICLERYLLRVEARFACGPDDKGANCDGADCEVTDGDGAERVLPWTTHVFAGTVKGGLLVPLDRKEVEEARWATVAEMVQRYRPEMLAWGTAGMRYRVDLQDAALRLLGLADPPPPPGGRLLRLIS